MATVTKVFAPICREAKLCALRRTACPVFSFTRGCTTASAAAVGGTNLPCEYWVGTNQPHNESAGKHGTARIQEVEGRTTSLVSVCVYLGSPMKSHELAQLSLLFPL